MTPAISFEELLGWSRESSGFWKTYLDANSALLQLPCDIAGYADVQGLVRHIWGADLIWSQRLGGLAVRNKSDWPMGPLDALFDLHLEAVRNFERVLADAAMNWEEPMSMDYGWLPAGVAKPTARKLLGHALLHSQRHWAQLTTLLRGAGFPSGYLGDLLFSESLR